jgi:hypothetical protein
MKIIIDIPEDDYELVQKYIYPQRVFYELTHGTPLTSDVLADMLMEERIRGELKQDIFYSKDVIDNVRCKLTVEIIDRRPCYCGAELREVWRERKDSEE